jgi:hypothetical protein
MKMKKMMLLWVAVMAGVSGFAIAGTVAQYDAARAGRLTLGEGNRVEEWRPVRGAPAMAPLHGESNGWGRATWRAVTIDRGGVPSPFPPYTPDPPPLRFHAVSFNGDGPSGGGVPSPMAFGEGSDMPAAVIYAVVRSEDPAGYATLIDAPVDARLERRPAGTPYLWQTEQQGNAAGYSVNGAEGAGFSPSSAFQLVAVRFGAETDEHPSLHGLFLGGAVPSPRWGRNWRGEVGEVLVFPSEPTPEEENAVRHYAAVKWGVSVPHAASSDTPRILRALGISDSSLFGTGIIVR